LRSFGKGRDWFLHWRRVRSFLRDGCRERNAKKKSSASKRMSDLIEAAWDESECTPMFCVQVQSMRQRKHGEGIWDKWMRKPEG